MHINRMNKIQKDREQLLNAAHTVADTADSAVYRLCLLENKVDELVAQVKELEGELAGKKNTLYLTAEDMENLKALEKLATELALAAGYDSCCQADKIIHRLANILK